MYLNGWNHPYCSLFQDYYAKCFHSLYGYFTTLKFRGLINTVIFQFVSIIPGYEVIIEKLKIDSLKIFTQKGSEFLEAKINFSNSSKDFLTTLKITNGFLFFSFINYMNHLFIIHQRKD